MGSVVVPDRVVDHFSYNNMFGGTAHHVSQESQAPQIQQRPASIRSSHTDASSAYQPRSSHAQAQIDTPMTDAISRSSSASGFSSHSQGPTGSVRSSTSNPIPQALHHLQSSTSRPPPSPRFRGHPSSQQHTPTSGGVPPHFSYPTSTGSSSSSAQPSPSQSVHSSVPPAPHSPNRIKVRSLSHIQSFTQDEFSPLSARSGSRRGRREANEAGPQYEISEMPVTDIIEMVAGLLTKITSTNDRQHEHIHRQIPPPEGTTGLSPQTNSVLAFHGKNVPQISILSYLSRIHKYCPTTYEVFLSLLVYFDRMTEMVNSGPIQNMRRHSEQALDAQSRDRAGSETTLVEDTNMEPRNQPPTPTPPPSGSLGKPAEPGQSTGHEQPPSPPEPIAMDVDNYNLSHFFVVDSYNIHRLVIAGVTCASKFFSDIFYTNSRYAKVCLNFVCLRIH